MGLAEQEAIRRELSATYTITIIGRDAEVLAQLDVDRSGEIDRGLIESIITDAEAQLQRTIDEALYV